MASSSSASNWECGACTSVNKGSIYCTMCATLHPKCRAVLGALAADEAMHISFTRAAIGAPTAVAALPAMAAKKAGTVNGAPTPVANTSKVPVARDTLKAPVAREAKASKECSPAMADSATQMWKWLPCPRLWQRRPVLFIQPVLWWRPRVGDG